MPIFKKIEFEKELQSLISLDKWTIIYQSKISKFSTHPKNTIYLNMNNTEKRNNVTDNGIYYPKNQNIPKHLLGTVS